MCVPVENVTVAVFLPILCRYQLQFGRAKGPPGTFPIMKAWTSDATLSSGHVSGSLGSRLEIGVVGSEVVRLPDVQQSTQWLPVSVVAINGMSDVVSNLLIRVRVDTEYCCYSCPCPCPYHRANFAPGDPVQ
jgi:hypothetical protein